MTIVFIGAYLCPFFPVLLQHGARSDRLLAPAIAGFLLGLLLDVLVLGDLVQLLAIAILERMAGLAPALTASSRLLAELAARALRQPRDRALPPRRPLCLPGISLRGLYLARRSHSTHLHRFALWDLYPHGTGVTRWLALVCADELGGRQHVPLDRLLEFGLRSAGARVELAVATDSLVRRQSLDLDAPLPQLLERLRVGTHLPERAHAHDQALRQLLEDVAEVGKDQSVPISAPPVG